MKLLSSLCACVALAVLIVTFCNAIVELSSTGVISTNGRTWSSGQTVGFFVAMIVLILGLIPAVTA